MSDIEKVLEIAKSEVGYLEKNNILNLNDKTANAGSGNYTKYWADIAPNMNGQAWCQCFVDWIFNKAFGKSSALNMLYMPSWTFYTPTGADYFKKNNAWYSSPTIGDIIYFKNSTRICHVGIVYKVDSTYVYTYEGNTSGGSEVIPNGGGVCAKKYAINNSRIAGYGRPKYSSSTVAKTSFISVGIDLSKYNDVTDYSKVKASGVSFAIIKIIERSGSVEPSFEKHYKNCINAGIKIGGVYNYSYATTITTAKNSANSVIKALNGIKTIVWLDIEDNCLKSLNSKLIDIIEAYKSVIESNGCTFGIYTGLSFYNDYIAPYIGNKSYPIWIARYGKNDGSYNENYKPQITGLNIWQYTSNGSLPGINGKVDMNVMFKNISYINTSSSKFMGCTTSDLNLRKMPSLAGDIVMVIPKGSYIQIDGESGNWYKTIGGYVSKDYINKAKGKVTASQLNIRAAATTDSDVVGILNKNEIVNIITAEKDWYYINNIGYVSGKYIELIG